MTLNIAWVALSLVRHIGNKTMTSLLDTFGSCDAILAADKKDLMAIRGIGAKIADAILAIDLDHTRRNIDAWQASGVQIIVQGADDYPKILKTIPDPPLTLFIRGNYRPELFQNTVAIVGTRNPSTKALSLARELAQAYAAKNWVIVSGLALGIDTYAHQGVVMTKSAPTVAVLAGGVLNVYPPQNQLLADHILENGVLLSENDPYATSSAARLVTRNRIISGLSQHIIVVQSKADGGAMHAARAAIKQDRDIFTVDWEFSGNQALLAQGAKPIKPDALVIPSTQ